MDEAKSHALRVLLIEDDADTVESTVFLLNAAGHEAQAAKSGSRGIELARVFRPHVIILDIGLPGMNGYDTAKAIRGDPDLKGIVLMAVSGYGREDDKRRARAAGVDHFFLKPADFVDINKVLNDTAREWRREIAVN